MPGARRSTAAAVFVAIAVAPAAHASTPADRRPWRVSTLAGTWRIAQIDGQSVPEPYPIEVKADAQRVWWEPACALEVRRYRIAGAAIAFTGAFTRTSRKGPPPLMCLIAPPASVDRAMRALDDAETISAMDKGVLISGRGRSVVLVAAG